MLSETETTIRLRRLLRAAYHELGNARDLGLGKTRWIAGEGESHWTSGSGARLMHNIEQTLNLETGTPVSKHTRRYPMTQIDYKGRPFDGSPRSGYEVMPLGFAVFNNHVNDADKRARALMSVIAPRFLEEVEQIERDGNGIMAIFNQEDTPATVMYATLVTAFVNERAQIERATIREAIATP